jgi:hypothetical protein
MDSRSRENRNSLLARLRKVRLLRRRVTIAAPKLAIKTHVPWYYKLGMGIVGLAVIAVGGNFLYEAGRKIAGFSADEVQTKLASQAKEINTLKDDNAKWRAEANAAVSKIQIEQAARDQIAAQAKALEAENAKLKEDLAFFEATVSNNRQEAAMAISRLSVERDATTNQLRYRMLLVRDARQGGFAEGKAQPEFVGNLQFVVTTVQDGKTATMQFPVANQAEQYRIRFKFFERAEGVLPVAPGAQVKQVQVKVMEGGAVRATQSVTLK